MIDNLVKEIQEIYEKGLEDLSSLNRVINYTYTVKEKIEHLESLHQQGSYQKHLCSYVYQCLDNLDWDSNTATILFGIRRLLPKLKSNYENTEDEWKQVYMHNGCSKELCWR